MPARKNTKKAPTKKAPVKNKSEKKAQPKKTTPRKKTASAKKKVHLRALVCAPGEKCFWTTDGQILEDLNQLQIAFGSMDEEVFLHHVTKEKNDFADWVEYVLEDAACASDLRRTKKPKSARTVVIRHLRSYNI